MSNDIIKRIAHLEKQLKLVTTELAQLNNIVNTVGNLMMQQTRINAELIQEAGLSTKNIQLNAEQEVI